MDGMKIVSVKTLRGDFFEVSRTNGGGGSEIGVDETLEILEHKPGGPGDSIYYDILSELSTISGFKKRIHRVFDPAEVLYEENEENE